MAWIEPRSSKSHITRWRMRDTIGGRRVPIILDLGTKKPVANAWLVKFNDAVKAGFSFTPPITLAQLTEFIEDQKQGKYTPNTKRLKVAELCDLYQEKFGPSLKGGVSEHYAAPYHNLTIRLGQLKLAWAGKFVDEITIYDVRDYLAQFTSPGTKLRHIGSLGAMFKLAARWNSLGNVIPFQIRLPAYNPFKEWRAEMPAVDKTEIPDERVLEPDEWDKFKAFLPARSRAICEIALRRFLRLADIKQLSHLSQRDAYLQGLQQKTGTEFLVPVIQEGPVRYDFTNFLGDFKKAQVAAGMNWPADHRKHFSPKDLRRTGATWAFRGGEDILKISAMLGHKKLTTTQRYLRIRIADVQSVANVVDKMANRKGPIQLASAGA